MCDVVDVFVYLFIFFKKNVRHYDKRFFRTLCITERNS